MKPILFNTDMTRIVKDRQKTATRRLVKARGWKVTGRPSWCKNDPVADGTWFDAFSDVADTCIFVKPPYRKGDVLYVREAWYKDARRYMYRADYADNEKFFYGDGREAIIRWSPSIHMPKEAARLFVRVTDVTACPVQSISDEGALREGCKDREDFHRIWNNCYAAPRPVKGAGGVVTHYESYPFEDIRETRTCKGLPWYVLGNPWTWDFSFERCQKPKQY